MSSESAPSKAAPPPVLYSFADPDELSKGLASFVLAAQDEALKKTSTFKLAISGGSLPKVLGQDLIHRNDVKWDKWYVSSPVGSLLVEAGWQAGGLGYSSLAGGHGGRKGGCAVADSGSNRTPTHAGRSSLPTNASSPSTTRIPTS